MSKSLNITQSSIIDFIESERHRIDDGMSPSEAFEHVAAQQILTQYLLDDDDIARGLTDGGGDGGYDGIFVFVNDILVNGEDSDSLELDNKSRVDIHFIQAKNQTSFSEVIIQNWKDSFANLTESEDPDRERYREDVIDLFILIRAILKQTIKKRLQVYIHFWAVSSATQIHNNLEKQAGELEELVERIIPSKNTVVDVDFITAPVFFELIEEVPDETMTLKGTKEPLCPDSSSAILTVSLKEYCDFITDDSGHLKKILFEANIRDYQGNVHVNQAIRETLDNKSAIDFWWLNNGITIIADSMARDMDHSVSLTNPRIVNGLQTSNEIARHCQSLGENDDDRKVLIKCIATSNYEAKAKIIQATNYQTSIPPAFLHSLETTHLQIERYFKNHGLHYDRRKSSGKNNGISSKDIVSISFLGQCLIATLLKQPDYARARPAKILGDENKYSKIFNENISLKAYYQLAKTGNQIKQLIKKFELTRGEQNDLLFHVIYLYCAKQSDSLDLTKSELELLEPPSSEDLRPVIELARSAYLDFGGNAQTAKSASFVSEIQKRASEQWGL